MKLVKLYDYEGNYFFVNPDEVVSVKACDSARSLSYIHTKDGNCHQVQGRPHQVVEELRKDDGDDR